MEEQQRQLVSKYINILLRRKKMIAFCILVTLFGGVFVYLKTPKTYQATALIIYQRQKINPAKMSPDVESETREMLATLTQQVTSRSSLEEIIEQFKLYVELRGKMPMEDVVEEMRKHVAITPSKGDVFRVSFDGESPKKVMLVTNAIASRFIEENLRFREEKATETSNYVKDELDMAKVSIDKTEAIMRDYKLQHYNEMPQQLQLNMARLNSLQEQLMKSQESIQGLDRTKILIQEQMNIRSSWLAEIMSGSGGLKGKLPVNSGIANVPESSRQQQLSELRALRDSLLLKYTDEHPEVKRLNKKLSELEGEGRDVSSGSQGAGEEQGSSSGQDSAAQKEVSGWGQPYDSQLKEWELQLKETAISLQGMKQAKADIEAQIKQYQAWIDATPVREAEWAALTRDYSQFLDHYQQLVARNLEAESAQSLERRQKGSQFKIVDSAHFPETPIEPDIKKIMLLAVALGLGLAGGLVLMLETLDTSFKETAEIESYLGVPVICSFPVVKSIREQKKDLIISIAWSLFFGVLYLLFVGALIYFWRSGRIIV